MARWKIQSLDGKSYSISAATADEAAAKAVAQGVEVAEKPVRVDDEPKTSGAETTRERRHASDGDLVRAMAEMQRTLAELAARESWFADRKRVHRTVRNAVFSALVLFAVTGLVLGVGAYAVLAMNGLVPWPP